jgi:ABC-type glutathione transport system ATPase component
MVSSSVTPDDVERAVVEDGTTATEGSSKRNSTKVSMIGADDPFHPREGKTLSWTNVNMTLRGNKKKGDKKILNDVWGEVPKREITAIMGPSGMCT